MDMIRRMGKRGPKPEYPDRLPGARLPAGAIERFKAVLRDGEGPGEFQRQTLMREIEQREAKGSASKETTREPINPPTMDCLLSWLNNAISAAEAEDERISESFDDRSWAFGHSDGYLEALKDVRRKITGEE